MVDITNDDAIDFPSNYEICDRTGFRVKRGGLVEQWNGLKVRPESFEHRHPQDFVKSKVDRQDGSERPEQTDEFITTAITAEDL